MGINVLSNANVSEHGNINSGGSIQRHFSSPDIDQMTGQVVELICELIRIPSFSREEDGTADLLASWFMERGLKPRRSGNNIMLRTPHFDAGKPSLLLCSHHDTVRPVSTWTDDPFEPRVENGRLTGLGSNDAGASAAVLSLVYTSLAQRADLPFNLHLALTAEEEIAGAGGLTSILDVLGPIDLAIVGEPTGMDMAIAEKGLLVLDCTAHGVAGHAARPDGANAISIAMQDIAWFEQWRCERESPLLGPLNMTVTQINAGSQHNVIPDRCEFVVDVRVTERYTHEEIVDMIRAHISSDVRPRSTRLRPSSIPMEHPIVRAASELNVQLFGSPTMSDQALMPFPSVKIGPGRSERSHTADEYVLLEEISDGLRRYLDLIAHYAELTA